MIKLVESFDVVRSAVTAYLERYPHWPAVHELVKVEGAYARYVLRPSAEQPEAGNRLGLIDLSMAPGGTVIEFGEPYARPREWTEDERRAVVQAEQEAIRRYRPADFDPNDAAQYAALDRRVWIERELAHLEIDARIYEEQEATEAAYYHQLEEVKEGLRAWLQARGIEEAASVARGSVEGKPPGEGRQGARPLRFPLQHVMEAALALRKEHTKITRGAISERLMAKGVYNRVTGEAYSERQIQRYRDELNQMGYDIYHPLKE